MKDRRKFLRFPVKIKAHYAEDNTEDWKQHCSIVNISREGMGVIVYLKTKLSLGCVLRFMVDVPEREKSVHFIGTLNWIKPLKGDPEYNYKGGIKLTAIDSEDKWSLLDYAYETWKKEQEADDLKDASSN